MGFWQKKVQIIQLFISQSDFGLQSTIALSSPGFGQGFLKPHSPLEVFRLNIIIR